MFNPFWSQLLTNEELLRILNTGVVSSIRPAQSAPSPQPRTMGAVNPQGSGGMPILQQMGGDGGASAQQPTPGEQAAQVGMQGIGAGLMATGNPYLVGAGVIMQGLSGLFGGGK